MRSGFMRYVSILLTISLFFSMMPVSALAASFAQPLQLTDLELDPPVSYAADLEAAGTLLREGMVNRQDVIRFRILAPENAKAFDLMDEIVAIAYSHTGVPTQGDYLQRQCFLISASASYFYTDAGLELEYEIEMLYGSTAQEEKQVDQAVANLLERLALEGMSDYEKISAIYTWMCQNVTVELRNTDDWRNDTAYCALLEGKATCTGIAVLLYRLLLELGIDSRVITGYCYGDSDAWNICRLEGLYYNLDAAGDVLNDMETEERDYFLFCQDEIHRHFWDEEFLTDAFLEQYPMAVLDYEDALIKDQEIAGGECGPSVWWSLTGGGVLTIFGEGPMWEDLREYDWEDTLWFAYRDDVRQIILSEGITEIGKRAFASLDRVACVSIPASLERIRESAFRGMDGLWHTFYSGTSRQWDDIVLETGNERLVEQAIKHDDCEGSELTDLYRQLCARCACEHTYDSGTVVVPDCWHKGYTLFTCTQCGHNYQEDFVDALEHNYISEVTITPTYEIPGLVTYTCTLCNHAYTRHLPVLEPQVEQVPLESYNRNGYDYVTGSEPISSYLVWEDGGYTRVEAYMGKLTVERYDEEFRFLSRRDIPLELPVFGGAYLGEDYNIVVVGAINGEERDDVEVMRVVFYDKNWERVEYASLYGANTMDPFDFGSMRFARKDDMLLIHTCHEMYADTDGTNHQSNMSVCVDIATKEIVQSFHMVRENPFGYTSHSFNQFVLVDGDHLLTINHGDAFPRSVVMCRTYISSEIPDQWKDPQRIDVFYIAPSTGHYNATGVNVGGFAASDTHYLVVGNSTSQAGGIDFYGNQRNIFITATPKDDFSEEATTLIWITDYAEGSGVKVGNPHLTKLDDGRFFLMWRVDERINCCFITQDGRLDGDVFELEGDLSDCAPVQRGDSLVWYSTRSSAPVFHCVDLNNPGKVTVPHTHQFVDGVCPDCGTRETLWGDVNGDGRVNVRDVRAILRYIAGLTQADEIDEAAADFNDDHRINARDARAILRHIAGLD